MRNYHRTRIGDQPGAEHIEPDDTMTDLEVAAEQQAAIEAVAAEMGLPAEAPATDPMAAVAAAQAAMLAMGSAEPTPAPRRRRKPA